MDTVIFSDNVAHSEILHYYSFSNGTINKLTCMHNQADIGTNSFFFFLFSYQVFYFLIIFAVSFIHLIVGACLGVGGDSQLAITNSYIGNNTATEIGGAVYIQWNGANIPILYLLSRFPLFFFFLFLYMQFLAITLFHGIFAHKL